MPFTAADGSALDGVQLRYRGGVLFQLVEAIVWVDPRDGAHVEIPAHDLGSPPAFPGNATDLASVPRFLWGLVASHGRQTLPAILHDHLSVAADTQPDPLEARRWADAAFRTSLREAGVTELRATTMWAAVSLQRSLRYILSRGIWLVALVALGAIAVIAGVVLAVVVHPAWLALLGAPLLLALPFGRDAGLATAAGYLGALYAPLIAAAAVASLVEYLVAVIVWLAGGRRGAAPRPGPTLRR